MLENALNAVHASTHVQMMLLNIVLARWFHLFFKKHRRNNAQCYRYLGYVFYIFVAKLKMNIFSFVGIACIAVKGKYPLGSHDLTKSAGFC